MNSSELYHWGIKGMKWGVRRYQNKDGTLTPAGKKHYGGEGNAGEEEAKVEYAPKRSGRNAEDYTDDELRARINRLQMEKQYRDLQGQTNIRADDPNKELKAEKERLQLQKEVKELRKEVYEGKSFVKDIISDGTKKFATKAVDNIESQGAKWIAVNVLHNPELGNMFVPDKGKKNDEKKDS